MRMNKMKGHHVADNGLPLEPDVNTDGHADRLLKIVNHVSRQNISMCWHCLTCSGGCPFSADMDLLPNQVIRLVQMGRGEDALRCRTIWICVGCHTCSSQCPNSIDVAAVMDALRQLAIRDGIVAPEMDIYYVAGLFNADVSVRRFPVVENGELIGVITRKDLLRGIRSLLEE